MYLGLKKSYVSIVMLLGIGLYIFGMFLLFDRFFLLLGSTIFLAGASYSAGFLTLTTFFIKPSKMKGTFFYFLGYIFLIIGWGLIGGLIQIIGIYFLFRDFLPQIYASSKYIPGIGPYICSSELIKNFVAKVSGNGKVNTV